jgi:hypothetical protein
MTKMSRNQQTMKRHNDLATVIGGDSCLQGRAW